MASSASRSGGGAGAGGGERMIHQDFIARIRFSNTLPPPPIPPKLLDIPNTGLSSGQYTSPAFATRLFREQPVNIEADAELGMPLDLVGMPGVFDGDESSIQAPAHPPVVHPHDRPLLRPLSTLGKPKVAEASVSFLRRTEYISAVQAKKSAEPSVFLRPGAGNNNNIRRPEKRKAASPDLERDTPAYIKRKIEKGFDFAAACLKDRSRVRHPTRRGAKLLDSHPMLPDLDAFPDSGAYVTVKFVNNPVAASNVYDRRLLSGLFTPIDRTRAEQDAFDAALDAHLADPEHVPRPAGAMNYQFYLPDTAATAAGFRRKWDVDNPDRNADEEEDDEDGIGKKPFRYERVRAYETSEELELDHGTKYDKEIVLSFVEGAAAARLALAPDAGGRAVLYYPVMQRSTIRSQRTRNIARNTGLLAADAEAQKPYDVLELTVQDPSDEMAAAAAHFREHPVDAPEYEGDEEEEDGEKAEEGASRGQSQKGGREGSSAVPNGNGNHVDDAGESDEHDAEGDEDE